MERIYYSAVFWYFNRCLFCIIIFRFGFFLSTFVKSKVWNVTWAILKPSFSTQSIWKLWPCRNNSIPLIFLFLPGFLISESKLILFLFFLIPVCKDYFSSTRRSEKPRGSRKRQTRNRPQTKSEEWSAPRDRFWSLPWEQRGAESPKMKQERKGKRQRISVSPAYTCLGNELFIMEKCARWFLFLFPSSILLSVYLSRPTPTLCIIQCFDLFYRGAGKIVLLHNNQIWSNYRANND